VSAASALRQSTKALQAVGLRTAPAGAGTNLLSRSWCLHTERTVARHDGRQDLYS